MQKFFDKRFLIMTGLIFIAAMSRLVPHPYNFSPIMALALFGGAYFENKKFAFIIPIFAMLVSDVILGFHATIWAVYISFAIGVLLGFLLRKKATFNRIILASISSSVIFFIFTNFAVWLVTGLYKLNLEGLTMCYTMALPFFRYTLAGDLVYCGALFGIFALAERYVPLTKRVPAK